MEQNMLITEEGATATDTEIPASRRYWPRRLALAALLASALIGAVTSVTWPWSPVPLAKLLSTAKEDLRVTLQGCEDTDNGATNRAGESCEFWNMWAADGFPDRCRAAGHAEYYDDDDYTAFVMCCACGGGSNPESTAPPPPPTPPPPSTCKKHIPEDMVYLGGKDTPKDTDDASWIEKIDEEKCRKIDQSDTDGPTIKVCGKVMVEAFTTPDCSASEEQVVKGECVHGVNCNVEMHDKKWLSYKLKRCPKCVDTDNGATNRAGESCEFWNMWAADGFPDRCRTAGHVEYYDDDDYTAFVMCCACQGGSMR